MQKNHKNKKAFTLIELLIVIAIIGILSSVILVSLNSAREKAREAKYISYVSQMTTVVKAVVQAGYFDSVNVSQSGCLGDYSASGNDCYVGAWSQYNATINNILQQISSIPIGEHPPITPDDYGMFINIDVNNPLHPTYDLAYIGAVVGTGNEYVCDKFGWGSKGNMGNIIGDNFYAVYVLFGVPDACIDAYMFNVD